MDEPKMNVSIPIEAVDHIIVAGLIDHFALIQPNSKPPMFSYDPEEDLREVKKLRKAFKRVINYYGGEVK